MSASIEACVKAGVCRVCHNAIKGICPQCACCGACGCDPGVDHHPEA